MRNRNRLEATSPWVLGRLAWAMLFCVAALLRAAAGEPAEIERRLGDAVRYLASDQLEGRGVGTKGLDLAAEFIARQFAEAGLKTRWSEGGPFQEFTLNLPRELGRENRLALVGPPSKPGEKPQTIELTVGKDFLPLAASGAVSFDRPLVFAGYGITAQAEKYDDFQGIDVSGKIVIVLRHEPQQDDPKSVFDGTRESAHARLDRKVAAALEHKAAGVIVCTDALELRKHVAQSRKRWLEALDRLAAEHEKLKKTDNLTLEQMEVQRKQIDELIRQVDAASKTIETQYDPLLPLGQLQAGQARQEFPIMQCRRAVLDRAVQAALGTDLAKLEQQIDQGPTPHSKQLTGWKAVGKTDIGSRKIPLKNVAAVLEGQGSLADETIVVGAHYDHIGYGRPGSRNADQTSIYYGADDNASGVAVLIEVARALAQRPEKLARRVVFVAFTAEEMGLHGSKHYVQQPLVPIEKTVAMVNLDMVGRLRDDRVLVLDSGSGKSFGPLLERICQAEHLELSRVPGAPGPSDQAPFYAKGVPVMHFFTGMHAEYHRTSDKAETMNVPGMRRMVSLTQAAVVELAQTPARPEYVKVGPFLRGLVDWRLQPVFGCLPAFLSNGPGFSVGAIVKGGPAERAGLRAGDTLVEFGETKIGSPDDFLKALRKHKPGDRVKTVVRRGSETMTVELTLDPPQ
jgi:hypothetical protein